MIPRTRKSRILVALLGGAIVIAAAGLIWALGARTPRGRQQLGRRFRDHRRTRTESPEALFVAVLWLDAARTHYYPMARGLRPPFRAQWGVRGRVLLEFTPVGDGDYLFLLKNNSALYFIRRSDGKVNWKKLLGRLAASSPRCATASSTAPFWSEKAPRTGGWWRSTSRSARSSGPGTSPAARRPRR